MTTVNLERVSRIDYLIRLKGTGSPETLARSLGISKRMVYHYINWMRDQGAPIKYCKLNASYYYAQEGRFVVEFR